MLAVGWCIPTLSNRDPSLCTCLAAGIRRCRAREPGPGGLRCCAAAGGLRNSGESYSVAQHLGRATALSSGRFAWLWHVGLCVHPPTVSQHAHKRWGPRPLLLRCHSCTVPTHSIVQTQRPLPALTRCCHPRHGTGVPTAQVLGRQLHQQRGRVHSAPGGAEGTCMRVLQKHKATARVHAQPECALACMR